MKVAHLLPAMEQGGVETMVCELNRLLVRAGDSPVVFSRGGRLAARIAADGGRHVAIDLKSKNPFSAPWRILRLYLLLRRERPDLVCVHSRVPAWLYAGARRLAAALEGRRGRTARTPWITYAHGANSVSRYSAVMTRGDLTVVPSQFLADYLREHYGTPAERFRVVPNGIDLERFDPEKTDAAEVARLRREWGVESGDRVVMAIGRITKVKGLDALIRDVAAEAKNDPRLKLVIVGGADRHHLQYLEELKTLARTLGCPATFAGPQAKIPECLQIADEVVSANTVKPESFGLSIVEAYAMNRPVRARRFGGAAEVMDAVARTGAPTLRAAVAELYGLDRFAARTLAVYREAAGAKMV